MLDEVLEEVEQREDRASAGPRRREPSDRCSAIDSRNARHAENASVRSTRVAASRPRSGSRRSLEPRTLLALGKYGPELLSGDLRRVALEDAGMRLHDLAERPERDPVPVWKAAPLPPRTSSGAPVDVREELGDLARLADSGLADDGDELHRAVADRTVEEATEE